MKRGKCKGCWLRSETWYSFCSGDPALSEQLERDFLGVGVSVEEARELREKVGQDAGEKGLW